jgi:hypothetical protein
MRLQRELRQLDGASTHLETANGAVLEDGRPLSTAAAGVVRNERVNAKRSATMEYAIALNAIPMWVPGTSKSLCRIPGHAIAPVHNTVMAGVNGGLDHGSPEPLAAVSSTKLHVQRPV